MPQFNTPVSFRVDGGGWFTLLPRQRELIRTLLYWDRYRDEWRTRYQATLDLGSDEVKARMADLERMTRPAKLWDRTPGTDGTRRGLCRLKSSVEVVIGFPQNEEAADAA